MPLLKLTALARQNVCEDIKQLKMSNTASGNVKWYTHFGEQFVYFLTKLNNSYPKPTHPTLSY